MAHRALHNAVGIVEGLKVTRQETDFTVTPGMAYDCFGRELFLTREQTISLPEHVAGKKLTLVLRRPAACSCDSGHTCAAELIWRGGEICYREGLPLAHVDKVGQSTERTKTNLTPPLRPLARPHIASGITPGNTVGSYGSGII